MKEKKRELTMKKACLSVREKMPLSSQIQIGIQVKGAGSPNN